MAAVLADESNQMWLSPISIWAFLLLAERGRVRVKDGTAPPDWVEAALSRAPMHEAPLNREVAVRSRSVRLDHEDPAARFLAATADVSWPGTLWPRPGQALDSDPRGAQSLRAAGGGRGGRAFLDTVTVACNTGLLDALHPFHDDAAGGLSGGSILMANSIVASNQFGPPPVGYGINLDCAGPLTIARYTRIQDTSACEIGGLLTGEEAIPKLRSVARTARVRAGIHRAATGHGAPARGGRPCD